MTIEKNWIQRRLLDRLTIWGKAGGHIEYMCSAWCIKLIPLIRHTVARESLTFLYNRALLQDFFFVSAFSFKFLSQRLFFPWAEVKKPTASLVAQLLFQPALVIWCRFFQPLSRFLVTFAAIVLVPYIYIYWFTYWFPNVPEAKYWKKHEVCVCVCLAMIHDTPLLSMPMNPPSHQLSCPNDS